MPFHMFGPPPPHIVPFVLTSALAFTGGAYVVARHGVPAGLANFANRMKARAAEMRAARHEAAGPRGAMFCASRANRGGTGNGAFEDYRAETLKKLEEEGAEFRAYLDGLRHAKDKVEFDQFVADRKRQDQSGA
jgi:hypothetical protein